jgi:hypothetical protein
MLNPRVAWREREVRPPASVLTLENKTERFNGQRFRLLTHIDTPGVFS